VIAPYTACPEADLSGRDLQGVNLTGANLIRSNLDRVNASAATLSGADLVLASINGAILNNAVMERTDLTHAVMANSNVQGVAGIGVDASRANLQGSNFTGSNFSEANFTDTNLTDAVLQGVNFTNADLHGANLRGATIAGVDFGGANLSRVIWIDGTVCKDGSVGECVSGGQDDPVDPTRCVLKPFAKCAKANLTGRDLKGVDLTGADLLEATLDNVDATEANFTNADAVRASMLSTKLNRANLTEANLTSALLGEASLRRITGLNLDASRSDVAKADFTYAVLTNASFAGANADDAKFASAALVGADLSAAKLTKVDLTNADLTNAVLRRANLRGATLTGAVLDGADFSDATWTDGRICREGSIGRCLPLTISDSASDSNLGFDPLSIIGLISSSIAIARFVNDCSSNVPVTGSCFDSGQRQSFANLQRSIDGLSKQIEANKQELTNALNEILENQKKQAVADRFLRVQSDLFRAQVAALKYDELMTCIDALDKGRKTCELTNSTGVSPQPWTVNKVDDLYIGSGLTPAGAPNPETWRPTEDMQRQGPVARLLFATMFQFGGGGPSFSPTAVKDRGLALQQIIAGDSGMPSEGLLRATVDWQSSRLNTAQGGTVGSTPAFIPGTYLATVNQLASIYLQGQVSYYAPVVAAFMLISGASSAPPAIVKEIESQVNVGALGNPQWALKKQIETYTTDLSKVGIDPGSTVDVTKHSDRPERVGFVIGADGKTLYRVQHVFGATEFASAHPDFDLPTYQTLEAVQRGLARTGVKPSRLGSLYYSVPGGGRTSAWYAKYGSAYRVTHLKTGDKYDVATVPTTGPQAFKWGDNVTYTVHDRPCVIPVRMMDTRPSFEDALKMDGGTTQFNSYKNPGFTANRNGSSRDRDYRIEFNALDNYYVLVDTPAVPAFNIINGNGTTVVYKCGGGRMNDQSKYVPADWVSVRTVTPTGVLSVLTSKEYRCVVRFMRPPQHWYRYCCCSPAVRPTLLMAEMPPMNHRHPLAM
jgi:uncharacterized protein YjbI with pentapeptide repeats